MLFPKNFLAVLSLAALSSSILAKPHKRACQAHSSVPATTPSATAETPDYGVSPTAISSCGPSVIIITTTDIVTMTVTAIAGSETITSNVTEALSALPSFSSTPYYSPPVTNDTGPSGSSQDDSTATPSVPATSNSPSTPTSSTSSTPAIPSSSTSPNPASNSGKATFYGGNTVGGACSFTNYELPAGMSGTAFSGTAWEDGIHCGSCLSVNGPKGNIKVMVSKL